MVDKSDIYNNLICQSGCHSNYILVILLEKSI